MDLELLYVEAEGRLYVAEDQGDPLACAYWQGQVDILQKLIDQEAE